MVYIYKDINSGEIKFTRSDTEAASIQVVMDEEGNKSLITLDKMIPQPFSPGYIPVLKADFKTGTVWYDMEVTLDKAKSNKIFSLVKDYKVKRMNLNLSSGREVFWIDSKTRTTILNSLTAEKQDGKNITKLSINDKLIEFPINAAIQLIRRMDQWDKQVYEVEVKHISNIQDLESVEEVKAYNHKTGYPSEMWASIGDLETEYNQKASKCSLDILLEFSTSIINSFTMSDDNVKKFKYIYPSYGKVGMEIGMAVQAGFIFKYKPMDGREPKLYRVINAHIVSEDITPDTENQDRYQLID